MKNQYKTGIAFIFILTTIFQLNAQNDAHYWTHQYGAKGLLLNGAVIASTDDETAVYYNPGAMGNGEDFGVSLTFFTPSYSILKTQNYLGSGNSLRNTNFGFTPGFAAVGVRPFKNKKIKAAFTSFTRFKSGLGARSREVGTVKNQEGLLFVGNLDFSRKVSQRWFGYGMAYRLNDKLSLGATQFAAMHSENALLSVQKEIVSKDNPYDVLLAWRSKVRYKFSFKGGLLTKFGLSATLGNIKIGLTATTPIYKYFLDGASYDLDDLKVYPQDSVVLISNLKSADLMEYHTPWSFGLGLDFTIKRTRVSFSTEYFTAVKPYTIIDDKDDPFNGEANEIFLNRFLVNAGEKAVLNMAVGLQTRYNDKVTMIWGARTDFNQRRLDPNFQTLSFLSTSPDIFHLSCGGFFKAWNNQFSLGLDYAFGFKKTNTRVVDLNNITQENLFEFSGSGPVTTRYQAFTLVFTYDFIVKSWKDRRRRLKDERQKELEEKEEQLKRREEKIEKQLKKMNEEKNG
ncbi:MAG: hypothetical protein ACI9XO_004778 [Paraglaciecola sp.]|jgi:hypothetical protein